TDPTHFDEWFEVDQAPRQTNVTALITGVGIDLDTDLSGYNQERLKASFYLNPANTSTVRQQLHNHAVIFDKMPFNTNPASLEKEISTVVESGEFVDMRHLLDQSKVTEALIGIAYIDDFIPDPDGTASHI